MLVLAVALAVTLPGLDNGFAYDDVEVIAGDPALHTPSTAVSRAFEPYLGGQMLRPVPLLGFAAQWTIGGGNPMVFRIVSLLLYLLVCWQVLALCRRCGAPPTTALLGALIFAVHPVHSEVTANGVGQAELLGALAVLGGVLWYLRARMAPVWRLRDTAVLAALALVAMHIKESGYVLPGLLIAVEGLVVRDPRSFRARWPMLREPALALVAVTLGSLAIRGILIGSLGGGDAHMVLRGMSTSERMIVALGFVPEWFRLLFWPARLQAEYGPPALGVDTGWGSAQLLGLIGIVGAIVVTLVTCRRAPLIALGVVWFAIAMAPVANFLFPTGILVAERTLFVPSVGLALALAGFGGALAPGLASRPAVRSIAAAATAAVLLAAAWRSAVRQPAWRDTFTVLTATARDAPDTYRVHLLLGREERRLGNGAAAEASFRRAMELWSADPRPFEELGQSLRARGECGAAIPVLERGVAADSTSDVARSRLVECLIVERLWDQAETEARRGLAQGVVAYQGALNRIAARRSEPPPD